MKNLKSLWELILGIILGIGIQWLSLFMFGLFPMQIQRQDPLANLLFHSYNSLGLIVILIIAVFFYLKRKWPYLIGVLLGIGLWLPFLTVLLAVSGL